MDLKGKHNPSAAVSHQKTTPRGKLAGARSNLNALKQTVALERDPPPSKENRETMERERGREGVGEKDGDGEKKEEEEEE